MDRESKYELAMNRRRQQDYGMSDAELASIGIVNPAQKRLIELTDMGFNRIFGASNRMPRNWRSE